MANLDFDELAVRIVKLTNELDTWIRTLRRCVPPAKPWQRALIALLDDADRHMQILRMTEAMEKSDAAIVEATVQLTATCRKVTVAIHGTRADALVKSGAQAIGKTSDALCKLVLSAAGPNSQTPAFLTTGMPPT